MSALVTISDGDSLPSLLTRAGQRLLDAKTSGEVLEAHKMADAALALARVTKAANETHADCLRIITRAEIRMADEIDAGQARGELSTREANLRQNADVRASDIDNSTVTLDDLGVSRQRLAEWREVRDAGPDVVEAAIQSDLAEGHAPTKASIRKHIRGTFGTGDNEWFTPAEYVDLARKVLGNIDLDPASHHQAQHTIRADRYFTVEDDGLKQEWSGNIWLNPPYAQPYIGQFTDKLIAEVDIGHCDEAIMLTHNYTDTAWFQKLAAKADAICFTRGRVRFESPSGELASPTQGQAFFYFGRNTTTFAEMFGTVGFVLPSTIAFPRQTGAPEITAPSTAPTGDGLDIPSFLDRRAELESAKIATEAA